MKNSTLLRLFFISIGIPLTLASSGPSFSSLVSKPTPKQGTLILSDTTNSAEAVQLGDHSAPVSSVSEGIPVPGIDEWISGKLGNLLHGGQYDTIVELGVKMRNDKLFMKYLFPVMTALRHFKGLFEYLKRRNMVPSFLAYGGIEVVKKVIAEKDLLETDGFLGKCGRISDAIAISFKEDNHNRAMKLFVAAHERPEWKDSFEWFVNSFFTEHPPWKNSMPLKRLFTLHGEKFGMMHLATFEIVCQKLVQELINNRENTDASRMLTDFVGQPFLLTPVAFVNGLFYCASDYHRIKFIEHGYNEAIEEGLKEAYYDGGRKLWKVMVTKFPNQFCGEYPSTKKARADALKDFPTKKDREQAWAEKNVPNFQKRLEDLFTAILPIVLRNIVFEYTGKLVPTWLDVEK